MAEDIVELGVGDLRRRRQNALISMGSLLVVALAAWRGHDLLRHNAFVECQKRAARPEFVHLLTLSPGEAARLAGADTHHESIGSTISRYLQMQGHISVAVTVVGETNRADSDSLSAAHASKYANHLASSIATRIDNELELASEQFKGTAITTVPSISYPNSDQQSAGTTMLTIFASPVCS